MTHTPGEWENINGMVAGFGKRLVARCGDEIYVFAKKDVGQFQAVPNAKLIAAAPELLQQCEYLVGALRKLRTGTGRENWFDILLHDSEKLIAKAKGTT